MRGQNFDVTWPLSIAGDVTTDPVYSKTKDTKYFKIVETYWTVKAMLGQALELTTEEKRDILHTIHIFEGKFELLCLSKFRIRFKVSPSGEHGAKQQQDGGSANFSGTKDNPIDLDSDPPDLATQKKEGNAQAPIGG